MTSQHSHSQSQRRQNVPHNVSALPKAVDARLREVCERHNAFLIDVVVRGTESRRVVEIYADSPNGMTLDLCSTLSDELGAVLDAENVFKGAYRLDVSSPGVERSLVYIWQYKHHTGRRIKVERADGTSLAGRIGEVFEASFMLHPAGKASKKGVKPKPHADDEQAVEVPLDQVRSAIVQIDLAA